jgi:hypothetical protein
MPLRSAALIRAEPVVIGSSDFAACPTRLTFGRAGSPSAASLPQPSGAIVDCASVSGPGRAAQLANNAQNRDTTTKRTDTRSPPPGRQRILYAGSLRHPIWTGNDAAGEGGRRQRHRAQGAGMSDFPAPGLAPFSTAAAYTMAALRAQRCGDGAGCNLSSPPARTSSSRINSASMVSRTLRGDSARKTPAARTRSDTTNSSTAFQSDCCPPNEYAR